MLCSDELIALTNKYFEVWNTHSKDGIKALHAPESMLEDWDATHSPTDAAVAEGIAGIWKAVPKIKIEVLNVFTSKTNTCVANIKVIVGDEDCTVLNVCDVIEYNDDKLVVALKAYKV